MSLLDQSAYAATNVLLSVSVARFSDAGSFGKFSVLYIISVYLIKFGRASVGQPLLFQGVDARVRVLRRAAIWYALGGLTVGVVGEALSWGSSLVMALAVPIVAGQDLLRHGLLRDGRIGATLSIDAAWLAVQVALLGVAVMAGATSNGTAVGAWGASAALSGVAGWFVSRKSHVPRTNQLVQKGNARRYGKSVRRTLLLDAAAQSVKQQLVIGSIAAIVSWQMAGAYRLVLTVLGFIPILYLASLSVVVPLATARLTASAHDDEPIDAKGMFEAASRRTGAFIGGFGLLGFMAAATGHWLGIFGAIFGSESWSVASSVFALVLLAELSSLIEKPIQIVLLSFGWIRQVVAGKSLIAVAQVAALGGALVQTRSISIALGALIVTNALGSVFWIWLWWRRRRTLQSVPVASPSSQSDS